MITSKQARLINLGLLINKFYRFWENAESDGAAAIYHTQYEKYRNEYFDLWFELNRDTIANKYIVYASEQGIEIEQIEKNIQLGSQGFIDFCLEICFQNL